MDMKEQRITFMNTMARAVEILIHNSKGERIEAKDVIDLARKLAVVALNPQLEQVMKRIKEDKDHAAE